MLPHTSGLYSRVSHQMFELCETLTPVVQRNSIDEGYLDLEPCGFQTQESLERAVRDLQGKIFRELQITASFGLATNKLVAQIASKLKKPRGFVIVPPGTEEPFLAPLSIGKLPGIGPKTEDVLTGEHGLKFVRDIVECSESRLKAIFGGSWREMLDCARGIDDRPVETEHGDAKSYSQQETFFENVSDFGEIVRVAKRMIDELMPKVRDDKKRVRTMTIKIRYPDFSQESHGRSLKEPSDLEAPFYPLVEPLLRAAWTKKRPLRLISVRFSSVEEEGTQLEMFAENDEKRRRLAGILDQLNHRSRNAVVQHGHQLAKKRDAD